MGRRWLAPLLPWCCLGGTVARSPHIVLIVADDLGWDDVGFRSGQIRTPNIDEFARAGLVLDQYYVQSVCSPSRATFMTGRYPLHHTVNDWLVPGQATALPLNETLLPEVLAQGGYVSHMTGKWHLGFTKWAHTPTFRGFQSFVGFYGGGEGYFEHRYPGSGYDMRRDLSPRCGAGCSQVAWQENGTYSTHIFTERSVSIINGHSTDDPLFLYLAYQAVHAPGEVPASYRDAYNSSIVDAKRRTFAGMLSCMDEGIGNVTAALRSRDMLEDTLIIFTTDNGGPVVLGDSIGSSNFPLRGGKHSIWEGGTRGTAVVWAGRRTGLIEDVRRGREMPHLMHGADWLPTLCGVAGLTEHCRGLKLDGIDQTGPLFRGAATAVRDEVFYGEHDDAEERSTPHDTALRDGAGWKFIKNWGGKPDVYSQRANHSGTRPVLPAEGRGDGSAPLLYNVLQDPGEHHEVSKDHPDIVLRMASRIEALWSTAVDVVGGGGTPDPTCPKYNLSRHQESHVGAIWEPWCDDLSYSVVSV